MASLIGRNRPGVWGGLIAYLVSVVVQVVAPPSWVSIIRERAFDAVLAIDLRLRATPKPPNVIVIDIDRATLAALGSWPWPRATMAQLVDAVAAGKPNLIAFDVLFAGSERRSDPATPARPTLGHAVAASPPAPFDGNSALATAIALVPTVLGSTLDTTETRSPPLAAVLWRGPATLDEIWRAPGASEPSPSLLQAAAGNGVISLPGDADGTVRRIPLLVGVGDLLRPGLAVEAVRVMQHASNLIVETAPQRLVVGNKVVALPVDGLLRLVPTTPSRDGLRTIAAIDVIAKEENRERLTGKIALIGGSAPELGGLRKTPADPLTPSVQIQASAVEQLIQQRAPRPTSRTVQIVLALVLGALALAAAVWMAPVAGVAIVLGAIAACWAGSVALSLWLDRLVDPLTPSAGAVCTFVVASLGSFITVSRREARIRDRFAQHLAPEVVKRIAENPDMLKLRAEKRVLTALFTDIEGFTTMTHRAGPEQLVAELDGYIEGVASLVMKHGGMVDKIVGDAVHAFFNAPIDLAEHATRAVECAVEIRDWSEQYRLRPTARKIGFGRTRVGIETGEAVVGDIGIRSKLDYTAHGDSINSAARLEAINKAIGSSICVGPVAAGYCDSSSLRPLGTVALRGLDTPIAIFEPWPAQTSQDWRTRYLSAFVTGSHDPAAAAEVFERLAAELPADPVPVYMARQLRKSVDGK